MKIAFNAQIFIEQVYGGISRYFCELAQRISKQNDTDILIATPFYINAYLQHLPSQIVPGFKLPTRINMLPPNLRRLGMGIGNVILRVNSPDIIHETYYYPSSSGPRHSKRVLTVFDMIHEKFASDFDPSDDASRNKLSAVQRADHIICISESTRRDLIDILGVSPDKISVIYLGFGLMDNPETVKPLPFSNKPFLLYVGSRIGYKNFFSLLTAYSESSKLRRNFNLVCFGGGGFNTCELEAVKMFGLNLDSVIQVEGDDQLLSQYYRSASAFVYPSLYEGFGIPPLEAMSFHCPVVCSNSSSIPEVVGDAGEYFNPTSVENIRDAIEKVVDSNTLRNDLIEKGKQRLNIFSWDRCARETAELYRDII